MNAFRASHRSKRRAAAADRTGDRDKPHQSAAGPACPLCGTEQRAGARNYFFQQ